MNLDEWQKQLEDELDKEAERDKLYKDQAEEIAIGLIYGKKINDGYFTWGMNVKSGVCYIAAARNALMFVRGYRPQMYSFKLEKDIKMIDSVKSVVEAMLKAQNGEYDSSMFVEEIDENERGE